MHTCIRKRSVKACVSCVFHSLSLACLGNSARVRMPMEACIVSINTAPLLACVVVITPVLLDYWLHNTQHRRHDALSLDLQTDRQQGKREGRCL